MNLPEYSVKVRPAGATAWFWLRAERPMQDLTRSELLAGIRRAGRGHLPYTLTTLRRRAALMVADKADEVAARIERENPGVKARAVLVYEEGL